MKMKKNQSKDNNTNPDIKSKKSKKSPVQLILIIICFCVFIGCAVYLGKYFLEINQTQSGVKNLKDLIVSNMDTLNDKSTQTDESGEISYINVDGKNVQAKYAELYKQNHDFVGWITIEDTLVDYPVMQSMQDNEFYIHRNFEQNYDGSGLPFLDNRCNYETPTSNLLIYGHNMKAGTMFSQIIKYSEQDFYEQHKTFHFDTIIENGEYEVVAAFYSQIYDKDDTSHFKYYNFFDAATEEEFNDYVRNIIDISCIETGIVPQYGDSLITLSTCAYNTENGRFAVVARKKD